MNFNRACPLAKLLQALRSTPFVPAAAVCGIVLLMHYWLAGEALHEWIGIVGIVAAGLHIHRFSWWFRTPHFVNVTPLMRMGSVIAIVLLLSTSTSFISGLLMSREALPFLRVSGMQSTLALIHLSSSHWMLLFAALHCGYHGKRLMSTLWRKLSECIEALPSVKAEAAISLTAIVLGAVSISQERGLLKVLFLRVEFLNMDAESSPILLFLKTFLLFAAAALAAAYTRHCLAPRRHRRVRRAAVPARTTSESL